ncbi:hypothetical protein AB0M48_30140 [Lentzea sp. NPDC051208]|uniref:hypothetical protein n=1 Tax=Lentzea sp. NPDC051208 TaxID=3154642 RepID=UPI0034166DDA
MSDSLRQELVPLLTRVLNANLVVHLPQLIGGVAPLGVVAAFTMESAVRLAAQLAAVLIVAGYHVAVRLVHRRSRPGGAEVRGAAAGLASHDTSPAGGGLDRTGVERVIRATARDGWLMTGGGIPVMAYPGGEEGHRRSRPRKHSSSERFDLIDSFRGAVAVVATQAFAEDRCNRGSDGSGHGLYGLATLKGMRS